VLHNKPPRIEKILGNLRPTVGFSGSGGAGKTPSPKNCSAGSRRVPSAAKPLSAANGVGRLFDYDAISF